MKIISSPVMNYDKVSIQVEWLVLHYTCLNLNQTLERFNQKKHPASSHFVIDVDGQIHECVPARKANQTYKAWHAGVSNHQNHHNLNDSALGIELINPNGNFIPYTQEQYDALVWLTHELKHIHPKLNHPSKILGHETIAGFRGKVDPGCCFDWEKYLKATFELTEEELQMHSKHRSTLHPELQEWGLKMVSQNSKILSPKNPFWAYLNNWLEFSQRKKLKQQSVD